MGDFVKNIKDYASYLVPENCQIYKIIKTNRDKETNNDDDYFEYEDGENVLVNHHEIHMEKPDMKDKKDESNNEDQSKINEEIWLKEKWYGTEYKMKKLAEGQVKKWKENYDPQTKHPYLCLPKPNPYLPSDFKLKNPDMKKTEFSLLPISKEESNSNVRFYYKLDDKFETPKANILIHFLSPNLYSTPENIIFARLYFSMLSDALNELSYETSIAGLSYSFIARDDGFELRVSGFSQNLEKLLHTVLEKLYEDESMSSTNES